VAGAAFVKAVGTHVTGKLLRYDGAQLELDDEPA
jgi:hypothetical protein